MLYQVSNNLVPVLVQFIANMLHSLKYFEKLQICANTLRFSDLLLYIGFWMNQVIAKIYYIEIKNALFSNSQSYFKIKKNIFLLLVCGNSFQRLPKLLPINFIHWLLNWAIPQQLVICYNMSWFSTKCITICYFWGESQLRYKIKFPFLAWK